MFIEYIFALIFKSCKSQSKFSFLCFNVLKQIKERTDLRENKPIKRPATG